MMRSSRLYVASGTVSHPITPGGPHLLVTPTPAGSGRGDSTAMSSTTKADGRGGGAFRVRVSGGVGGSNGHRS
jgi:hypothetical protein